MALELGFQPLEQGEGVGRGAGEAGDDLAVAQPPDLLGVALDDGLAHRDLAVARHHHLAALADRQDGRGVPAGRLGRISDCGDMAPLNSHLRPQINRHANLPAMTTEAPVIVIGAGIVGTATARALQRAGHAVTLLDSAEPGRATSYGNAGFIAIDHVLPLARPSTLKRVPQMLMDRNGPLTVHPPSLPCLLPWMARFARAAYSHGRGAQGHGFASGR